LGVRDREDEPAAEAVVVAGGILPWEDEPRPEERLDRMPVLPRGHEKVVPAFGRIAEPEGPRGAAVDPAPLEIGARARGPGFLPEPRLEPASGPLGEREEAITRAHVPGALALGQGNAGPRGQEADSFGELEPVVASQELESVAARVAAEAV